MQWVSSSNLIRWIALCTSSNGCYSIFEFIFDSPTHPGSQFLLILELCELWGIVSEKSQRHTGDFQYLSNNCGHQVVLQVHPVLGHLPMQVLLISCTFSQYVYCYMYISVLFKE